MERNQDLAKFAFDKLKPKRQELREAQFCLRYNRTGYAQVDLTKGYAERNLIVTM